GEVARVDRMDERKPAGGGPGLVRLQVADEVPLRALYRVHLHHRLLDSVLAQDSQPGIEGRPADLWPEPLGDRDDRDLLGVAAGQLRRLLAAHLVTAAADPRADPRAVVAAAVLVTHEARGGRGLAGLRPPPARVDQPGDALLRVPQHDGVAVCVSREEGDALA